MAGKAVITTLYWYTEKMLLTHSAGAMQKYYIGAILLDLNDPSKVIGRLIEPLLSPN